MSDGKPVAGEVQQKISVTVPTQAKGVTFGGLQNYAAGVGQIARPPSIRVVVPSGSAPSSIIKHTETPPSPVQACVTPTPMKMESAIATLARNATQSTFAPRQVCPTANIAAVNVTSVNRSTAQIRTPNSAVASLSLQSSFVRGNAIIRNTSAHNITISNASNATWINPSLGQLHIRTVPHQTHQRNFSAQGIPLGTSQITNSASENSILHAILPQSAPSTNNFNTSLQARHSAVVYSSPQAIQQNQQQSPAVTSGHYRVSLAPQISVGGLSSPSNIGRNTRTVSATKASCSNKLSTTTVSIRPSNIACPLSAFVNVTGTSTTSSITVAARNPSNSAVSVSGAYGVHPTSRVFQVHPMIFSSSSNGKMGRQPISISPKVQHSLTITQLGPKGNLPPTSNPIIGSELHNDSSGILPYAIGASSHNITSVIAAPTAQMYSTCVDTSASGATVIPVTIIPRGNGTTNSQGNSVMPAKNNPQTVENVRVHSTAPPGNFLIHQRSVAVSSKSIAISPGVSILNRENSNFYDQISTATIQGTTNTSSFSAITSSMSGGSEVQIIGGDNVTNSNMPLTVQKISSSYATIPVSTNESSSKQQSIINSTAIRHTVTMPLSSRPVSGAINSASSVQDNAQVFVTSTANYMTAKKTPGLVSRALPKVTTTSVQPYPPKREIDGSSKRAAKNLAPTLLSMAQSREKVGNNFETENFPSKNLLVPQFSAARSAIPNTYLVGGNNQEGATDNAHCIPIPMCASPVSTDGSTTVSASSSPDVRDFESGDHLPTSLISDSLSSVIVNELHNNNKEMDRSAASENSFEATSSQICVSLQNPVQHTKTAEIRHESSGQQNYKGLLMTTAPPSEVGNSLLHMDESPPKLGDKENTEPIESILKLPRSISILHNYQPTYKLGSHHFQRHADLKVGKGEQISISDLSTRSDVLNALSGWKVRHLQSQMKNLAQGELEGFVRLEKILYEFESDNQSDESSISELLKGNIQRSKFLVDGIGEAQQQLLKIFEHKIHISNIMHRSSSRCSFQRRSTNQF